MRDPVNKTRKTAACGLAALCCAVAPATAAQAQLSGADVIGGSGAMTAPAPAGARILQAGQTVGDAEISRLLTELRLAGNVPVILLVPGSAVAQFSDATLAALASARNDATFVVVQQGDADLNGAAAILEASADQSYLQQGAKPPSGTPGPLWQKLQPRPDCADGCLATQPVAAAPATLGLSTAAPAVRSGLGDPAQPLGSALLAPAPEDGGIDLRLLALAVVAFAGLVAIVALALAWIRRPGERQASPAPSEPVSALPDDAAPRRSPVARPPRRVGGGERAEVVSVLDPEGYVELDRCLRRVRWGAPGDAPAAPGDWVDVQDGAGRLWAFPAQDRQSRKSTA